MRVATVTPIYQAELTPDEWVSLRHLRHFLGSYEHIAVVPEGLDAPVPGFRIERFPAGCFKNITSYNRLLLSEEFYARFAEFDYILIYQLDCLVFSDELPFWCSQELDYIGAPWLNGFQPKAGPGVDLWRVGNGGFSLRRVESCLRTFRDFDRWRGARLYWKQVSSRLGGFRRLLRVPKLLAMLPPFPRNLSRYLEYNVSMEDWFWSVDVLGYRPSFKVATLEQGLAFAFEMDPAFCFERAGRRRPFGAHAWTRYDRAFWTPFLLP